MYNIKPIVDVQELRYHCVTEIGCYSSGSLAGLGQAMKRSRNSSQGIQVLFEEVPEVKDGVRHLNRSEAKELQSVLSGNASLYSCLM